MTDIVATVGQEVVAAVGVCVEVFALETTIDRVVVLVAIANVERSLTVEVDFVVVVEYGDGGEVVGVVGELLG